jgi:hypothetical protein
VSLACTFPLTYFAAHISRWTQVLYESILPFFGSNFVGQIHICNLKRWPCAYLSVNDICSQQQ